MQNVDIVVFTSKLCNLRCRYCYELTLLSDKTRISLDQMEHAFRNFDSFFRRQEEETTIRFCWHGGEPLLIEPDYYWKVFELQRRVFAGSQHRFVNSVQSNLTVLDDRRLELLKHGFDQVGVSLDLFGGLRVDAGGRDLEPRTLENLERLRKAGVSPCGITVLTRCNMNRMPEIFGFYRDRGMSFRVLPLEPGLYEAGQTFEIGPTEILRSLCTMADRWLMETPPIRIEPIHSAIEALMGAAARHGASVVPYDLTRWQWVILLDTNGEILLYSDGLSPEYSSGNIFELGFDAILRGEAQRRKAQRAQAQIAKSCSGCPYFLSRCNGHPVAEGGATMHEILPDGTRNCIVTRGLFQHLEARLLEAGVLETPGVLSAAYLDAAGRPVAGSIA